MHYVVGDIHGCYDDMMSMIKTIEDRDDDATIIFVGDFVDRGPKSEEVINWVMDNVSDNGKYQTVLGNHDERIITGDSELKKSKLKYRIQDVEKYFARLPLYKKLNISMASGQRQTFVIAHASMPENGPSIGDKWSPERRKEYLWSRQHFWGYGGDAILVHGHTPTIDRDYHLRGYDQLPGFVNYRNNCINVDGGCVFLKDYYLEGPCMLCAICLETLTEIYACSWEERLMSVPVFRATPQWFEGSREEFEKIEKEGRVEYFKERYANALGKDCEHKKRLLEKTGLL